MCLVLLPFGLQVDTLPGGFLPRKAGRLREIALETLHGLEAASRELAVLAGLPVRLNVVDEMPDSLGKLQFNNLDIAKSDVVVGPLMRENVGVAVPRIDRFGREHVLLTEQPERYVERGMAVRQSVASELAATELLADLVATRHDTDNVVLVVTGASDAALEAAFESEFNAIQREKWLTREIPCATRCSTPFKRMHVPWGALRTMSRPTSATWWCLWRAAAHAPCGRRCRRSCR